MEDEELFEIFKLAIDKEREAYSLYQTAAAGSSDPGMKRLFEELAKAEMGHERKLEERYRELRRKFPTK